MQNYKAVIAYEGNRYKGFQTIKNDSDKTIQGKLENILYKLYDEKVEVISAVNTAPGVDASMQVINFKTPHDKNKPSYIFDYFEEYLPNDIVVLSLEKVDNQFHSRYQLKEITYTYRLWKKDAPHKPLFERNRVKVMDQYLDVDKMKSASQDLIGEHDFKAFTNNRKAKTTIKTINGVNIDENEFEIVIELQASQFLLNMERYIIGTLIEVGLSQKEPETIKKAFSTLNEKHVGHKTMAGALCLSNLEY